MPVAPTKTSRKILQFSNGKIGYKEDIIVTEHPVTVKINNEEFVTMVCTPEHIEDMVIGYLASEGVIRKYEDIQDIWFQEKEGFVHVKTGKINSYYQQFHNKRYITSCCGASRQGFVFVNDKFTAKRMNDMHVKISVEDCFHLMNNM